MKPKRQLLNKPTASTRYLKSALLLAGLGLVGTRLTLRADDTKSVMVKPKNTLPPAITASLVIEPLGMKKQRPKLPHTIPAAISASIVIDPANIKEHPFQPGHTSITPASECSIADLLKVQTGQIASIAPAATKAGTQRAAMSQIAEKVDGTTPPVPKTAPELKTLPTPESQNEVAFLSNKSELTIHNIQPIAAPQRMANDQIAQQPARLTTQPTANQAITPSEVMTTSGTQPIDAPMGNALRGPQIKQAQYILPPSSLRLEHQCVDPQTQIDTAEPRPLSELTPAAAPQVDEEVATQSVVSDSRAATHVAQQPPVPTPNPPLPGSENFGGNKNILSPGPTGTQPEPILTPGVNKPATTASIVDIRIKPIDAISLTLTPPDGGKVPFNLADSAFGQHGQVDANSMNARNWSPWMYYWQASEFCHKPLYFEEHNLERYGHSAQCNCVQSAISGAHFFATIPFLPYKIAQDHPCYCNYTLGHSRPGNCNAWEPSWSYLDYKPAAVEAASVLGFIYLIP